jgi:hypothetical protein
VSTTTNTDAVVPENEKPSESRSGGVCHDNSNNSCRSTNTTDITTRRRRAVNVNTAAERLATFRLLLEESALHPETPWMAAMKVLIKDSRYTSLKSADERQRAFETYCTERRNMHEKDQLEVITGYYRAMIGRLAESGQIDCTTPWNEFVLKVKDEPAHQDMMTHSVAGAVDCFDSVIEELSEKYQESRRQMKQVVRLHGLPGHLDHLFHLLQEQGLRSIPVNHQVLFFKECQVKNCDELQLPTCGSSSSSSSSAVVNINNDSTTIQLHEQQPQLQILIEDRNSDHSSTTFPFLVVDGIETTTTTTIQRRKEILNILATTTALDYL